MTMAKKTSAWVDNGKGILVHSRDGAVLVDGKPVRTYRNKKTGTIFAYIPKNKELGRPGTVTGLGRLILSTVHGIPFRNHRSGFVIPKDGNKWNIQVDNLAWIRFSEFAQDRVIRGEGSPKLNVISALSLRDVVNRMRRRGVKDYDAIGSAFGVSGTSAYNVFTRKSWGYANKYVQTVGIRASGYDLNKAREAVSLYADYDQELANYMASYAG